MAGRVAPAVVREREIRAWDLYVREHKTQSEIAEALSISQPAVSQILARVERRVLTELTRKVERQKATQHSRLEHIYREAMLAWESSKKPRKKTRQKEVNGGGMTAAQLAAARDGQPIVRSPGAKTELLNEAATSDGNFLFLQTALGALGDLRKLWGINAPKKLEVEDKRRPLEKLTDEQLRERAAEAAALLAVEGAGA